MPSYIMLHYVETSDSNNSFPLIINRDHIATIGEERGHAIMTMASGKTYILEEDFNTILNLLDVAF